MAEECLMFLRREVLSQVFMPFAYIPKYSYLQDFCLCLPLQFQERVSTLCCEPETLPFQGICVPSLSCALDPNLDETDRAQLDHL